MNTILETTACSVVTSYLVSLYKLALPSAPSWALVLCALFAGLVSAALVTMAGTEPITQQTIATTILQGIGAAAIAAGLTRTDQAAEEKRAEAKLDAKLSDGPARY